MVFFNISNIYVISYNLNISFLICTIFFQIKNKNIKNEITISKV